MESFSLDNFLKNYKPKKQIDVRPYLRFDKSRGYKLLGNMNSLTLNKIYIMYIKNGNVGRNDRYNEKDIEDGGMLISGGIFLNGEFVELNDEKYQDCWTHLKLRTNISKKTGKKQKYYSYYIKIFDHVIFYIRCGRNDKHDFMVELLGKL